MEKADVFEQLKEDDVFRHFVEGDFDAKAHASTVIVGMAISQQLEKLSEGISVLDRELHNQVVAHHDDLLSQATGIETLEGVLELMQTRIQSLMAAVERIRSKVAEPYTKIVARTTQLRRLQETCELLRRIIRIMYLSKRLQSQLAGGAREITKAAQSLNELDYLCEGVDLTGVEVVESDRRFIKQARREVEAQAQRMLEQGMDTMNQTQVATSLQVFHNLGSLEPTVENTLAACKQSLRAAVKSALDVTLITQQQTQPGNRGPGKSSLPANTAAFRATLWTNMEKLMDAIYSSCCQAQNLYKVLLKKRDPVTHILFIEHLNKAKQVEGSIMVEFWQDVTSMLREEFASAAAGNTFVKQALEGEYPKLLRLYNDLWRRLQAIRGNMAARQSKGAVEEAEGVAAAGEAGEEASLFDTVPDTEYDPERSLKASLSAFETAYLSRSLSRLFDPVNLVFSAGSLHAAAPTPDEVDGVVKTITSELSVASVDPGLSVTVARNVAKTIQLYGVKSEQLLSTDGEASQVIGPPTEGQTRNAAVVNSLFHLHTALAKALHALGPEFPAPALDAIHTAMQGVESLMSAAVAPLLSSVGDALQAIVLTMHNEDFSGSESGSGDSQSSSAMCSLYMRELQDFIVRVASQYLTQYQCTDFIMDSVRPVACACVDAFVRHASLIRPLGETGKLRLAADFAQMELAIAPLARGGKVADLGRSYRILRAVRPMLFQTAEHIGTSPAVGEIIPHSTAIHFLFSRAPPELRSPHQSCGWSVSRYTQWLDDHPAETDRLHYIKGALESYVSSVKSRQGTEFAAVYPIMLDLLTRGLSSAQQQQT